MNDCQQHMFTLISCSHSISCVFIDILKYLVFSCYCNTSSIFMYFMTALIKAAVF